MLAVLILCHVVVYRALNFMQSKSRVRSDEKLKVLLHATYIGEVACGGQGVVFLGEGISCSPSYLGR